MYKKEEPPDDQESQLQDKEINPLSTNAAIDKDNSSQYTLSENKDFDINVPEIMHQTLVQNNQEYRGRRERKVPVRLRDTYLVESASKTKINERYLKSKKCV